MMFDKDIARSILKRYAKNKKKQSSGGVLYKRNS